MIEAIDADGDGEIEKEEFIQNAMNCHFIYEIVNGDVINGISQLQTPKFHALKINQVFFEILKVMQIWMK